MQFASNAKAHLRSQEASRAEFYSRLDKDNLTPLWEVLHA